MMGIECSCPLGRVGSGAIVNEKAILERRGTWWVSGVHVIWIELVAGQW